MNGRLAAASAVVLLAGGCAGGEDGMTETQPPPPPAEVEQLLEEVERTRPGVVLQDFVRAAARGDERRMWERLSVPTRRRLGPTLAGFRRGEGRRLEQELASLGRRHDLVLSQPITASFAVAAVSRPRGRASDAYAVALRLEVGLWRIELGGPVRIRPLRPKPGERVSRRTQLAAEVAAGAPIVEAGLWLDGLAFASRGGALGSRDLTMFGEAAGLQSGVHSVVAFASTDATAAARAWTFRARG